MLSYILYLASPILRVGYYILILHTNTSSMDPIILIFLIAILVMSVVIHEVSHGYVAEMLGDSTARFAGRLTLNPWNHFDMVGSFIVPVLMYVSTGFVFGWAKPVPYNPYNLKNQKWGPGLVAAAGPVANLGIALVFGTIVRLNGALGLPSTFVDISIYIISLNIILAVFNMVPISPLDGSKVLAVFVPYKYMHIMHSLEKYSLPILLVFVFIGWRLIEPVIDFLFRLITGLHGLG